MKKKSIPYAVAFLLILVILIKNRHQPFLYTHSII